MNVTLHLQKKQSTITATITITTPQLDDLERWQSKPLPLHADWIWDLLDQPPAPGWVLVQLIRQ